jgi:adenylate cyclase
MCAEGLIPTQEGILKAEAAVNKSLEIDDTLNEAYTALGGISFNRLDIQSAARYWKLSKDVYGIRYYSSALMQLGRKDESITVMKKAVEMDPLSRETNKALGARYFWARQYDRAIEQLQKTIELDQNYPDAHDLLADVYARKGMYKESIEEEQKYLNLLGDAEGATELGENFETFGYQQARRKQLERTLQYLKESEKQGYVSPVSFAQTYALLNQKDEAFAWLEKCYQERSPWLVVLKMDPQYDNLRSDPRLADLLKRIGFPE